MLRLIHQAGLWDTCVAISFHKSRLKDPQVKEDSKSGPPDFKNIIKEKSYKRLRKDTRIGYERETKGRETSLL